MKRPDWREMFELAVKEADSLLQMRANKGLSYIVVLVSMVISLLLTMRFNKDCTYM